MNNTLQLFNNDTVLSVNEFYNLTRTEMISTLVETSEHSYQQGYHNGITIGLYYGVVITLLITLSVWFINNTLGKKLKG